MDLYFMFFGLTVILIDFCAESTSKIPLFRRDYQFKPDLEAFYKLHHRPETWRQAQKHCLVEGSELFYPTNRKEAQIISRFMNRLLPRVFDEIFIGIHSLLTRREFVTLDGIPISDLYNDWAQGQPDENTALNGSCVNMNVDSKLGNADCDIKLPFICKKRQSMVTWNNECDMYDLAYKYNSQMQRCYKLHPPNNWTEAFRTCLIEESNLVVINSPAEAQVLVELVKFNKNVNLKKKYLQGAVHIGFHSIFGDGHFVTVHGQTLKDAGYEEWGNKQPDNTGGLEKCGSMFLNGKLNDVACHLHCLFICEHEPREAKRRINPRSIRF